MKYHLISVFFKIFWRNQKDHLITIKNTKKAAVTEQPFCLSMHYSLTTLQESNYLTCNIQLLIKSLSW